MGASYFDVSVDQGGQRLGASAQQVPSALFASCGSKLPSLVPWCFRTHYLQISHVQYFYPFSWLKKERCRTVTSYSNSADAFGNFVA